MRTTTVGTCMASPVTSHVVGGRTGDAARVRRYRAKFRRFDYPADATIVARACPRQQVGMALASTPLAPLCAGPRRSARSSGSGTRWGLQTRGAGRQCLPQGCRDC